MGFGKTLIALGLICQTLNKEINPGTLIVMPTSALS